MESKDEIIGHILAAHQIKSGDAVMIGERSHDVLVARANQVAALGVGDTARAMNSLRLARSRSVTGPPSCLDWPRFDNSHCEAREKKTLANILERSHAASQRELQPVPGIMTA
jgi:hypothetical protein